MASYATGADQEVRAKVKYKGRDYYQVAATKDGARLLLSFRDGSKTFWVAASLCETVKTYGREYRGRVEYPTIASLARYAERARNGEVGCRCDGRPGGYCCGRSDCQCFDCQ
jgi:hypothetical protein